MATETGTRKQPRGAAKNAVEPIGSDNRIGRLAQRQWVSLASMQVNKTAQREFVKSWADELATEFDPEQMGLPVVNIRNGVTWIIDGQHRIEALKTWLGKGWEEQQVEVEAYNDLTEVQEAEIFLRLNNKRAVNTFNKFRLAVRAGRAEESAVAKIVTNLGLRITLDTGAEGRIMAVGTLMRIYQRSGPTVLARTLSVLKQAWGDAGLHANAFSGLSYVLERYDEVDDGDLIERLSAINGGEAGVKNKAEQTRRSTGFPIGQCWAAAIVDTYNVKAARGEKITSWWKV